MHGKKKEPGMKSGICMGWLVSWRSREDFSKGRKRRSEASELVNCSMHLAYFA
jgi:hypothetical protein